MDGIDNTLLASIIGAGAAIIAAIISPLLVKRLEIKKDEKFIPSSTFRDKKILYGKWIGYYDQKVGKDIYKDKHKVVLVFESNKNLTGYGEFWIMSQLDNSEKFYIVNTVFDGRVCKFDYINKNNKTLHFGTIFVEISANGMHLNGNFLGYGILSERIVSGKFFAEKDKSFSCEV